jgi:hypothetical protein
MTAKGRPLSWFLRQVRVERAFRVPCALCNEDVNSQTFLYRDEADETRIEHARWHHRDQDDLPAVDLKRGADDAG